MVAHLAHDGNLAVMGKSRTCSRADSKATIVIHNQTTADVALRGSCQMTLHKTQLADGVISTRLLVRKQERNDIHDSHSAIFK